MSKRIVVPALAAGLIALAGCEADREVFEETDATLEPAPEIENAPITDDVGAERLERNPGAVVATDTLQAVQIDTTR